VKPPQQARSQKTLERLLDAAEELISQKASTALTVSEIVGRAGSSVGAFYARFPDKEALLATLHTRSCGEALATAEVALEPQRWQGANLARVVSDVVRFTARMCEDRLGLLVAFVGHAAMDSSFAERRTRLEVGIAELFQRLLVIRRHEVTHPDLDLAAAVAIRMVLSVLEYGAVMNRGLEAPNLTAERTIAELVFAVTRYLGVEPRQK
jgi:AcrR family transcriptional regulator